MVEAWERTKTDIGLVLDVTEFQCLDCGRVASAAALLEPLPEDVGERRCAECIDPDGWW